METFRVVLVGGPKSGIGMDITASSTEPPTELAVDYEQTSAVHIEEQEAPIGTLMQAVYVHHETDADGVAVYAHTHNRRFPAQNGGSSP